VVVSSCQRFLLRRPPQLRIIQRQLVSYDNNYLLRSSKSHFFSMINLTILCYKPSFADPNISNIELISELTRFQLAKSIKRVTRVACRFWGKKFWLSRFSRVLRLSGRKSSGGRPILVSSQTRLTMWLLLASFFFLVIWLGSNTYKGMLSQTDAATAK